MEKVIRVLVVDDHQVIHDGLSHLLGLEEDIKIIGQGTNAEEALLQLETLSPDIVLMDIKMPGLDGIELTRQIMKKTPSCKIIVLTLYEQYVSQAMAVGARGYLLKDLKREQLSQSIRAVYSGEVVIDRSITSYLKLDHEERPGEKTEEDYDTNQENAASFFRRMVSKASK